MNSLATRSFVGAVALATTASCVEPVSNLQEPIGSSTSTTGGSTSGVTSSTTSTGPSTNTATSPGTTTSGAGSSSSSTSGDETSAGTGTTGGELPDNACLVKDSYGDLGMADDALGFFVNIASPRSTGVDVFLTDSATEPFDVIIIELFENLAPFNNVPQPGMYDIEDLGGTDACGGVCISLNGDAAFDNGFIDGMFTLAATSGTLNITGLQWDPDTTTNGMVEGNLQDVVFQEYDALLDEIVADGCSVTLERVSFSEPVTSVLGS